MSTLYVNHVCYCRHQSCYNFLAILRAANPVEAQGSYASFELRDSQQAGDEYLNAVNASPLFNCCEKSAVSNTGADQLITWSEWGSLLNGKIVLGCFLLSFSSGLVCTWSESWVCGCWCLLSAPTDSRVKIRLCGAVMPRGLIYNTHFSSGLWCRTSHW